MTQQVLVRIAGQHLDWQAIQAWPLDASVLANAQLHHAADQPGTYLQLFSDRADDLAQALQQMLPAAQVDVLRLTQSVAGASATQRPDWLYIVETDIQPEVDADFNRWYAEEHLPGLAAVEGTVRAERWLCEESSPRYVACYALVNRETFGCPAWLAVRATPWSDRIRPHFTNTRRTMFTTHPHPERP